MAGKEGCCFGLELRLGELGFRGEGKGVGFMRYLICALAYPVRTFQARMHMHTFPFALHVWTLFPEAELFV